MKIPMYEALSVTQMIIPEIDLEIKNEGGDVRITAVALPDWHYYIDAMENASDLLLDELGALPDIKPVIGIEAIALELNCLITSFNMFYECTIDELIRFNKQNKAQNRDQNIDTEKEINDAIFSRFSKYRAKINRNIRRGKLGD